MLRRWLPRLLHGSSVGGTFRVRRSQFDYRGEGMRRCSLPSNRCAHHKFQMRLSEPEFAHPPEVYQAIIQEHRSSGLRMGEFLMACGWSIGDAAWAVVNWNLRTLAAAIANERTRRGVGATMLTEDEVALLKKQIQVEKKATTTLRPRKTTRIVHQTPQIRVPARKKPGNP